MPGRSDSMYSSCFMLENVTSSFYLKSTKFTRNLEFCSNCGSAGTQTKLEQIHNFLWIWSTSGKMIVSCVFWAFWHFLSKNGRQKYSAWVPRDPFYAYEGYKCPQGYWNVLHYFDFEYFVFQIFSRNFCSIFHTQVLIKYWYKFLHLLIVYTFLGVTSLPNSQSLV